MQLDNNEKDVLFLQADFVINTMSTYKYSRDVVRLTKNARNRMQTIERFFKNIPFFWEEDRRFYS